MPVALMGNSHPGDLEYIAIYRGGEEDIYIAGELSVC